MRLSFNQSCHALVAFSLPNFRVKDRPPERLRGELFASSKEMLDPGKRPNKEMT
jgi:hypothetical protein